MTYIVRIYFANQIFGIDLTQYQTASIGTGANDTLILNASGLKENHIKFIKTDDGWKIVADSLLYLENSNIKSDRLKEGNTYTVNTAPKLHLSIHPKLENSHKKINLDLFDEITIGRSDDNDIILNNPRTSKRHCKISRSNGRFILSDCGSKNGTYVNSQKIKNQILNDKDIINISIYQIVYNNSTLKFLNSGNDIEFRIPFEERPGINVSDENTKSAPRFSTSDIYINEQQKNEGTSEKTVSFLD